ncbi:MAG: ABC transporter permease [Chloroflexi bacterium]|nr:ABC transporter permease [Chloroflexota bacterium]
MTSASQAAPRRHVSAPRRPAGWTIVAAKEFADHLLSVRFYVLILILGAAALIPLYFAGERIRAVAPAASEVPGIFLFLFRLSPPDFGLLRVDLWVSVAAPLLGVAFAFDAVNGERHEGTLPRLLSQPIHRDDVINGKFVAGLAIITVVLLAVVLVITGFGMLRLGIVPTEGEVLRVVLWFLVTLLYVALWLAVGVLVSVLVRGAATSALIGLGLWLFVAMPFIGPALFSFVGGAMTGGDPAAQQFIERLLPSTIYYELSSVLLNPEVATTSNSLSISQQIQSLSRFPNAALSVDQSLLLIWPHIVTLFALTIGCFALAYTRFMRQEVRA